MASVWAASLGAIAVSTFSSAGLELACATLKKVLATRSSIRPERSIAAMVLSKVGAAVLAAIASISAICCFIAVSKAG